MSPAYNWREVAEMHRPTDPALLAAAIRRLADNGLTERDIAAALRLDAAAVRRMLTITANSSGGVRWPLNSVSQTLCWSR